MKTPRSQRCRPGLTLLELVVVLVILAVLTGIAVTSVEHTVDQGCYDATQRTLREIRTAVVGEPASSDVSISGFVVHMGRLPNSWQELTTGPVDFGTRSIPMFSMQPTDTASFLCGQNGPYLRLPPDVTIPRDGWGRDLQPAEFDLLATRSVGADGQPGGEGYNDDLPLNLILADYAQAAVKVRVCELDAGQKVDPTGIDVVEVSLARIVNGSPVPVRMDRAPGDPPFVFTTTNLYMGPVALQARQGTTKKSPVIYLNLTPRSSTFRELIIR